MSLEEYKARRARLGYAVGAQPLVLEPLPKFEFETKSPEIVEPPKPQVSDLMGAMENELESILSLQENQPWVSIADVKDKVRKAFRLRRGDIEGQCRARFYVIPRQISMYLCTKYTGRSLPIIGREHGNRDHTTVLHAQRKIARWLRGEGKL